VFQYNWRDTILETKNTTINSNPTDLTLLFSLSPDILCMVDEDGSILKVNQKFIDATGFKETELPSSSLTYLLRPEDYHPIVALIQSADMNAGFSFETGFLCSDNTYKDFTCSAVKNQKEQTFISAKLSGPTIIHTHIPENESKILGFSLDVICALDSQGYFIQMNKASLNLFGYEPEELLGKRYTEFIYSEDLDSTHGVAQVMKSGELLYNFENRYIRKDGSIVAVLWKANWIEEDQIFYCVAREATERKNLEEAAALNEKRFRALVQSGSDLLAILTAQGEYKYVSPTVSHILGYDPAFYIGRSGLSFIHPDDQEYVSTIFETIPQNYKLELKPYRFSDSNGKWHWLETVLTNLLNDPAVNGIVLNSRDITARKQIEDERSLLSRRLNHLIENNTDALFTLNNKGIITSFNSVFQNIRKLPYEELLYASLWDVFPNKKNLKFLTEFLRSVKDNTPLLLEEYFEEYNSWFEITAYPHEDSITVFLKNITELKNQQLTLRLEKEVLEMNISSNYSLKEIVDHLLTGMEHIYRGMICSVLKLDTEGKKLSHLSAPSLPDEYTSAIDGIEIGPTVGSCGSAAYLKKQVIVSDIENHPNWQLYKDLALPLGLRSCWSFPVITSGGKVMAAFGIYHKIIKEPTANEIKALERVSTILQLLLENSKNKEDIEVSNERYKYTIAATNDTIWDWDLVSNQLYRGNGFEKFFGQESGFEPKNSKQWESNLHPDDSDRVTQSLDEVIHHPEKINWREEYRYKKTDGSYAIIVDKGYVIRNEEKNAIRMVGAMQDVTERRKSSEKLIKSEENYKMLFSQNPTPMCTYDLQDEKFSMVNDAALALFGYSRDEFLSLNLFDIRVKEEHSRLKEDISASLFYRNNSHSSEWNYVKKDKSVMMVEVISNFFEINDRKSRLIAIKDITFQKNAQLEIIDQNKRLREIAQISSHEFRKPVASILGLVKLFDRGNPCSKFNSEIIDYLDITANELDVVIHTIVKKTWKEEN
jgi:PAS domain S-box-containing protein